MMRPERKLNNLINVLVFTVTLVSNSWAGSDVKTIDTTQLHSMIVDNAYRLEAGREKNFMVIDVRTKDKAATAGYTNVVIYSEGFLIWKEKNMPIAPIKKASRNAALTLYILKDATIASLVNFMFPAETVRYADLREFIPDVSN